MSAVRHIEMKLSNDYDPESEKKSLPDSLTIEDRFRLEALEVRTGYRFNDPFLARTALTHCSQARQRPSYERLEFLGDAVLELVISEELYHRLPDCGPGELTRRRAEVVCREQLAAAAVRSGLSTCIDSTGLGAQNQETPESVIADVLEAVLGAVYLDGGAQAARNVVKKLLARTVDAAATGDGVNWKARLQEFTQAAYGQLPEYRIESEVGPPHTRIFHVRVLVAGQVAGLGQGRSKKAAEKDAARDACTHLLRDQL